MTRSRQPPPDATGSLSVSMDVPSAFLRKQLPAEVRDAHLTHVANIHANQSLPVSPGLYHVSTVLDDGLRHSKVVAVVAGQESNVRFADSAARSLDTARVPFTPPPVDPVKAALRDYISAKAFEGNGDSTFGFIPPNNRFPIEINAIPPATSPDPGWTLESISGAKIVFSTPEICILDATSEEPQDVPCLSLRIHGRERCVSLPVNWYGGTENERVCTVRLEPHAQGAEPRALIPRNRNVSSALQQMVSHGQLFQAHELVVQAKDLLVRKYQDPVGAALGALVLYQTGTLKEHRGWLENLRKDFDWLPDGKILSAALALEDREDAQAADYLLAAAAQRPMFTLSFSILIDLMRRWNRNDSRDAIQQALEHWSDKTAHVDWLAFTFTVRGAEKGETEES